MSTSISRFKGDAELLYEITECLRNRILDQKFIYLGDGGKTYYKYDREYSGITFGDSLNISDWNNFIKKNSLFQGKSIFNFISIACGDSLKEKELIDALGVNNINYIGVDFSEDMINLSTEILSNAKFNTSLIRSDVTDIDFKRYLDGLVKKNEKRFFSFLGNTFGNIRTTNIADLLGSYLKKGDILGIDIVVKKKNDIKSNVEIFNHYINKTSESKLWRNHILSGFNYINFPTENGKIIIETQEEEEIGLFKIIFSLEMIENTEFQLEGNIILSKGERIKFYELYIYEADKLIDFMELHHFTCLDTNIKGMWGQFLFEKE